MTCKRLLNYSQPLRGTSICPTNHLYYNFDHSFLNPNLTCYASNGYPFKGSSSKETQPLPSISRQFQQQLNQQTFASEEATRALSANQFQSFQAEQEATRALSADQFQSFQAEQEATRALSANQFHKINAQVQNTQNTQYSSSKDVGHPNFPTHSNPSYFNQQVSQNQHSSQAYPSQSYPNQQQVNQQQANQNHRDFTKVNSSQSSPNPAEESLQDKTRALSRQDFQHIYQTPSVSPYPSANAQNSYYSKIPTQSIDSSLLDLPTQNIDSSLLDLPTAADLSYHSSSPSNNSENHSAHANSIPSPFPKSNSRSPNSHTDLSTPGPFPKQDHVSPSPSLSPNSLAQQSTGWDQEELTQAHLSSVALNRVLQNVQDDQEEDPSEIKLSANQKSKLRRKRSQKIIWGSTVGTIALLASILIFVLVFQRQVGVSHSIEQTQTSLVTASLRTPKIDDKNPWFLISRQALKSSFGLASKIQYPLNKAKVTNEANPAQHWSPSLYKELRQHKFQSEMIPFVFFVDQKLSVYDLFVTHNSYQKALPSELRSNHCVLAIQSLNSNEDQKEFQAIGLSLLEKDEKSAQTIKIKWHANNLMITYYAQGSLRSEPFISRTQNIDDVKQKLSISLSKIAQTIMIAQVLLVLPKNASIEEVLAVASVTTDYLPRMDDLRQKPSIQIMLNSRF